MATDREMELHLLAVQPERRGEGIGRALLDDAVARAHREGAEPVVLWTQPAMLAARRLYERVGFTRAPARDWRREDRSFLVYELALPGPDERGAARG